MTLIIREKIAGSIGILAVLTLLMVLFTGVVWGAENATATVTGKLVNIRSSPSTSAQIVTQVPKGTELSVLGRQGDWYQVTTKAGKTGWIAGYLVKVQEVSSQPSPTATHGEVKIIVDGKLVDFDAPPYIDTQNRTMVPIRFVAEELGSQVFWDADEKKVTITGGNQIILLWIGHQIARVSGTDVALDTVPVVKENRTMVPLRFVGENLGVQVSWDGPSRTVTIASAKPSPEDPTSPKDPGSETQGRIAIITGSVVNVRSGPGTSYDVVTQVRKGDTLTVLGESNDWYQVQTVDGYHGWVANWLVSVRADANPPSRSPEPGERPRPSPPVYTGENYLTDLLVNDLGDKLEVVIKGEHPLNYNITSLNNPQRVVLDFYNTTLDLGWDSEEKTLAYNQLARAVRVGQFTETQARVVIDLLSVASPTINLSDDGTELTLKLQPPSIQGKVIVIDPGHGKIQPGGWSDPGAVGPAGLQERDVNTDIAWKLYEILQREGATVIMTRTGSTTNLDLAGRAQIANDANADIFVSIHCNASTNPAIAGTSTYYYAPWDSILGAQRASRQRLATLVQQELVAQLGRRDIGILEANFAVLRETRIPSILVETAFISNREEEQLLATEEFRAKAAQGIAKGIMRYFAEP